MMHREKKHTKAREFILQFIVVRERKKKEIVFDARDVRSLKITVI
jgi:hypothetical protein